MFTPPSLPPSLPTSHMQSRPSRSPTWPSPSATPSPRTTSSSGQTPSPWRYVAETEEERVEGRNVYISLLICGEHFPRLSLIPHDFHQPSQLLALPFLLFLPLHTPHNSGARRTPRSEAPSWPPPATRARYRGREGGREQGACEGDLGFSSE